MREKIDTEKTQLLIDVAEQDFQRSGFSKGIAYVHLLRGKLLADGLSLDKTTVDHEASLKFRRSQEEYAKAIGSFTETADHSGLARTRCEFIRTLRKHNFSQPVFSNTSTMLWMTQKNICGETMCCENLNRN